MAWLPELPKLLASPWYAAAIVTVPLVDWSVNKTLQLLPFGPGPLARSHEPEENVPVPPPTELDAAKLTWPVESTPLTAAVHVQAGAPDAEPGDGGGPGGAAPQESVVVVVALGMVKVVLAVPRTVLGFCSNVAVTVTVPAEVSENWTVQEPLGSMWQVAGGGLKEPLVEANVAVVGGGLFTKP